MAFARRFGLPQPEVNARVAGCEVDAVFCRKRLLVELDGWDFHSSRESFIADRDRDAYMLALGLETVRITCEWLTESPEREARRLRRILQRRLRQRAVVCRAPYPALLTFFSSFPATIVPPGVRCPGRPGHSSGADPWRPTPDAS